MTLSGVIRFPQRLHHWLNLEKDRMCTTLTAALFISSSPLHLSVAHTFTTLLFACCSLSHPRLGSGVHLLSINFLHTHYSLLFVIEGQGDPMASPTATLYLESILIQDLMGINLHCQLDGIYNHLGNQHPNGCVFRSVSPERFNRGGKTHHECGQHQSHKQAEKNQ